MKAGAGLLLAVAASLLLAAQRPEYLRAKRKIDSIEQGRAAPGAIVTLTVAEINAWVQTEAELHYPEAIRRPVVSLGEDRATGQATVDFSRLNPKRNSTHWLLERLLEGERQVSVTARLTSGNGWATVELERVEISGIPIEGRTLNFLVDNFFRPRYPDTKIGEPFELGYNVEAIRIRPDRLDVKMRHQP